MTVVWEKPESMRSRHSTGRVEVAEPRGGSPNSDGMSLYALSEGPGQISGKTVGLWEP